MDIESQFIRIITGPDGFLVKLHSYNQFDDDLFLKMCDLLKKIAESEQNSIAINKKVAGSCNSVMLELSNHIVQSTKNHEKAQQAYGKFLTLTEKLFWE